MQQKSEACKNVIAGWAFSCSTVVFVCNDNQFNWIEFNSMQQMQQKSEAAKVLRYLYKTYKEVKSQWI